jgi:hypothetical protein
MLDRQCSKSACRREAVATLTYVYADSMAVVGPLAPVKSPHGFDLCAEHADRLSAPRGWRVVRHQTLDNAG